MNARDMAISLGQNLDVFDLRNHLIDGDTGEFLSKLQKNPKLASTPLDENNGEVLLLAAIRCNNTESAKALIDFGADINLIDMFRKSILLEAIECGLFDLAQYLIEKGAKSAPASVGDYARWLAPKYAQEGFLSETGYRSLIDQIKKGNKPKTNF